MHHKALLSFRLLCFWLDIIQMVWEYLLTTTTNNFNDHNSCFPEQLILVGATTSSLLDGCGWVSELKEGESPALAALLDVVGEEQVRPLTVENSHWVRQCYRQY